MHENIHTGDRPYKCEVDGCVYAAAHRNILNSHKRRMHKESFLNDDSHLIFNTPPAGSQSTSSSATTQSSVSGATDNSNNSNPATSNASNTDDGASVLASLRQVDGVSSNSLATTDSADKEEDGSDNTLLNDASPTESNSNVYI